MKTSRILAGLLALGMVLAARGVMAWGADGHRITGYVAAQLLTPATRVRLNAILPAADLGDVATWLDEERPALKHSIPGSDKWHFINQPVCGSASLAAICPRGDCAPPRIDEYRRVLSDPGANPQLKAFAVRVLVHLVGDIHQPLHVANNDDYGGNDVPIGRFNNNLHAEWDTGLVRQLTRGTSPQAYAVALVAQYRNNIPAWEQGAVADWIAESHELAVRNAYGPWPGFTCGAAAPGIDRVPREYIDQALPVVEMQLVKAGARIAAILNAALGR